METRRFFKLTQIVFFGLLFPLFFSSCEVFEEVLSPENNSGFIVNTTDDTSDINPGDDICEDENGNCSLRAAVQEANTRSQVTYSIELQEGNYLLDSTLELKNPFGVLIKGKGPERTVVNGNGAVRVFDILKDEDVLSNIAINDLTISGGNPQYNFSLFRETAGGGIRILTSTSSAEPTFPENPTPEIYPYVTLTNVIVEDNISSYAGGGIALLAGRLVLESCIVRNNRVPAANLENSGGGYGGGIYNKMILNVISSSVYQNETSNTLSEDAESIGEGGGIFNALDAQAFISNSTISDNSTEFGYGTGISSINGSRTRISNSSIIDNDDFGIKSFGADSLIFVNTVVSNSLPIGNNFYTLGGNFIDDLGSGSSRITLLGTPMSPDQLPGVGETLDTMLSSFQRIINTWGYLPLFGSPLINVM